MNDTLLNPARTVRVDAIGAERQPLLIIDDCLAEPQAWRAAAAGESFAPIGRHYPGVRAYVAADWAEALRAELAPAIADAFAIDPVPALHECFYSIVTTAPTALAPIQRFPHVDGLEPDRLAVLLYLSGEEQGGTAFFRQRATGYETVDAARFPAFDRALHAGVAEHGLPGADYIAGSTALYEQVGEVAARPNRAVVYRSHLLHCALIPAGLDFSSDPGRGRLTVNAFLFG